MATVIQTPKDIEHFRADIREHLQIVMLMLEDNNYQGFSQKEKVCLLQSLEVLKAFVR